MLRKPKLNNSKTSSLMPKKVVDTWTLTSTSARPCPNFSTWTSPREATQATGVALVPEMVELILEGVVDHLTVAEEEDSQGPRALGEIRTPQYSWEILPTCVANKRSGSCLQARAYSR